MGADATRCRETVRALAGTWLPPAKTQGHNLRVTIEIGLGEVAPRAESECEGLDRDFLLAPCPTAIVLDSIALVQCLRSVGLLSLFNCKLLSSNRTAKQILRPPSESAPRPPDAQT
jgi:hypothetical protein